MRGSAESARDAHLRHRIVAASKEATSRKDGAVKYAVITSAWR